MVDRPDSSQQVHYQDGRGHYDRGRSAEERRAEHIDRLVEAAAIELTDPRRGRTTVQRIVRRARVGRNTFYRTFRDLDQLVLQLQGAAVRAVWRRSSEALATAFTPIEKLRALGRAWFAVLAEQPDLARAALSPRANDGSEPSQLGEAMGRLLDAAVATGRKDAVLFATRDELRLLAAIAVTEALGRRYLHRGGDPEHFASTLVDLLLRIFR